MRISPVLVALVVILFIAIFPVITNPLVITGLAVLLVARIAFSVRRNHGWNVRSAKRR